MMGCLAEWKRFVACLFFDEPQQPIWPHVIHNLRRTGVSPVFRQSLTAVSMRFNFLNLVRTRALLYLLTSSAILSDGRTLPPLRASRPPTCSWGCAKVL